MNEIIEYKLLWDCEHEDLENKVNALIKDGWQPQGGVAINHGQYCSQVLVKYKTPRKSSHGPM